MGRADASDRRARTLTAVPRRRRILLGLPLLYIWVHGIWAHGQPTPADALTIAPGMFHLRAGATREWSDFPERAYGAELIHPFQASHHDGPRTLRLRHRDLKASWRVLVNGQEIARLPLDESETLTYWDVPESLIRAGSNELRVQCAGRGPDDVLIGEVALISRSREQVLSEATIDVSVVEEPGGQPVPARLTVTNAQGALVTTGNVSTTDQAVRPGVLYSRTGNVRLHLPAGRYVIYAGRGFEYSVARADVDLRAGTNPPRQLAIRREVDTPGWAAMDTHVHTATFARHGDATIEERMLTIAGEGLELPVSTEHNMRVDFRPKAAEARVNAYFSPLVGSEVTTPALGHFNVFGLPPEGTAIDERAADWRRLRASISAAAADPVVVLNHGRDVHGGFRPLDPARHISVAGENLDGWVLPANAMEVVNSGAVMTDALALARDWMGLLNRGIMLTPVGSSDSHDVTRYIVGQGRTYVRVDDGKPGHMDQKLAVERVRAGQVMVSYGLLAEIEVNGRGPGQVAAAAGDLDVRLRVKGPGWSRAKRVALYVNGAQVRSEEIVTGARGGLKWESSWRLPKPAHDVHLAAVALGPGIAAPYWPTAKPYQPTSIEFVPYSMGLAGAVFVDADGNGRFESAFEYARREVTAARSDEALLARLAAYDTAVAVQAASVLRALDASAFESRVRGMIARASSPHVRRGLDAYLTDWKAATPSNAPPQRP